MRSRPVEWIAAIHARGAAEAGQAAPSWLQTATSQARQISPLAQYLQVVTQLLHIHGFLYHLHKP
jgi:hypothetical protein